MVSSCHRWLMCDCIMHAGKSSFPYTSHSGTDGHPKKKGRPEERPKSREETPIRAAAPRRHRVAAQRRWLSRAEGAGVKPRSQRRSLMLCCGTSRRGSVQDSWGRLSWLSTRASLQLLLNLTQGSLGRLDSDGPLRSLPCLIPRHLPGLDPPLFVFGKKDPTNGKTDRVLDDEAVRLFPDLPRLRAMKWAVLAHAEAASWERLRTNRLLPIVR